MNFAIYGKSWSKKLDYLLLKLLFFVLCLFFYLYFFGIHIFSVLSAMSTFVIFSFFYKKNQAKKRAKKEVQYRKKMGGELFLQDLLFKENIVCCKEILSALEKKFNFEVKEIHAQGIVAQIKGERVYFEFLKKDAKSAVHADEVLCLKGETKKHHCIRAVLLTSSDSALERAEEIAQQTPCVRIFNRQEIVNLVGKEHAITDQQIREIQNTNRILHFKKATLNKILNKKRAKKYAFYGTLLLLLYFVTGLIYYPILGTVLILMATFSRGKQQTVDEI